MNETQSAGECLPRVLHELSKKAMLKKLKVKVRPEKVTIKQKSQTCHATHIFRVILHVDIDSDSHLTLWRHPA